MQILGFPLEASPASDMLPPQQRHKVGFIRWLLTARGTVNHGQPGRLWGIQPTPETRKRQVPKAFNWASGPGHRGCQFAVPRSRYRACPFVQFDVYRIVSVKRSALYAGGPEQVNWEDET